MKLIEISKRPVLAGFRKRIAFELLVIWIRIANRKIQSAAMMALFVTSKLEKWPVQKSRVSFIIHT